MAAVLTLLFVGGTALFSALTSEPAGVTPSPGPATSGAASNSESPSRSPGSEQPVGELPLRIKVVATTDVVVRVSDSGEVLHTGVLAPGDVRQYSQTPLSVIAANGAALQVTIYGKVQPPKPANQRGEWFIPEQ